MSSNLRQTAIVSLTHGVALKSSIRSDAQLGLPDFGWASGVHLDLGAGSRPRNPTRCKQVLAFDILDQAPFQQSESMQYVRVVPGQPLPLKPCSVASVSAFDFLEHLPRFVKEPDGRTANYFILMMNEIWRVLEPGGCFIGVTPCYPAPGTFVDPTHVNPIGLETVDYFAGPVHARNLGYGFEGNFEKSHVGWIPYSHWLWRTQELEVRTAAADWPPPEVLSPYQKARRSASNLFRSGSLEGSTQHLLWILRKLSNE